eukprot:8477397-Pyramimonas_sp.AAC.1
MLYQALVMEDLLSPHCDPASDAKFILRSQNDSLPLEEMYEDTSMEKLRRADSSSEDIFEDAERAASSDFYEANSTLRSARSSRNSQDGMSPTSKQNDDDDDAFEVRALL